MCGRYALFTLPDRIRSLFGLAEVPASAKSRWNVAPTQDVLMVRVRSDGLRLGVTARWGFIASWSKDPAAGPAPINARADTAFEKPMFRKAMARRRCLLPADGFYEWQAPPEGAPKKTPKQPFFVRQADGEPFGIGAIWDRWGEGESAIDSCAVLTTEPNELMTRIHDRMPLIIPKERWAAWLDPKLDDPGAVMAMVEPYPAELLEVVRVGRLVNAPGRDEPGCIEPLGGDGGENADGGAGDQRGLWG